MNMKCFGLMYNNRRLDLPKFNTIVWLNGDIVDIAPETLYQNSFAYQEAIRI